MTVNEDVADVTGGSARARREALDRLPVWAGRVDRSARVRTPETRVRRLWPPPPPSTRRVASSASLCEAERASFEAASRHC